MLVYIYLNLIRSILKTHNLQHLKIIDQLSVRNVYLKYIVNVETGTLVSFSLVTQPFLVPFAEAINDSGSFSGKSKSPNKKSPIKSLDTQA